MKQKIKIVDPNGKVLEGEYKIRDYAHIEACQKYRATVVEDKRFKAPKHKNKIYDEY